MSEDNQDLQVGDRVQWNFAKGKAEGEVVKIAEKDGTVSGFHYKASPEDPRYIVETDSGKKAAHKGESLEPVEWVLLKVWLFFYIYGIDLEYDFHIDYLNLDINSKENLVYLSFSMFPWKMFVFAIKFFLLATLKILFLL